MAAIRFLKRGILNRILGIPATKPPADPGSWTYSGNVISIDLTRATELSAAGGALRCEGGGLPMRVLVIRDDQGNFRAFHNRCTHLGHRRLDPVPGAGTVQCCSVNKSTFNYDGKSIHGPGKHPVATFPVSRKGDTLLVTITNA